MHIKGVSPEADSVKMSGSGIDSRIRRQNPVSLRQRPPRLRLGSRIVSPANKDQSLAADQAQTRHQKTKSWHGSGYIPTGLNASEFGEDLSSTSCHKRANSNDSGNSNASSNSEAIFNRPLIHHQRHNLKNRFQLLKTLGEGTYGKVKLAADCSTGEYVAIKYIKKTKIHDEADLVRIRREIQILSNLKHSHIVNIREVFEKKDKIVLVMDYAQGGELYDYLNKAARLSETEARRIFRQIVSAIHYCHQNGIVHRDLKLENIILDDGGNVKIADFGLANYFSYDKTLETFCGSPLYASPEIVNGNLYHGPEVDVWSLGVILYTLVYGAMPFESNSLVSLKQQISHGSYAQPSQPSDAAGLIRHMLTVTPSRRASMEDALCHWWLNFGHSVMPNGAPYCPDNHYTSSSSSSPLSLKRRSNSNGHACPAPSTLSTPAPLNDVITNTNTNNNQPPAIRPIIHHAASLSAPVGSSSAASNDIETTMLPPPPPLQPLPQQPTTFTHTESAMLPPPLQQQQPPQPQPTTFIHQRNQSSISSDSDLELDFKPTHHHHWSNNSKSTPTTAATTTISSNGTNNSPSGVSNSSSTTSPNFPDESDNSIPTPKDNNATSSSPILPRPAMNTTTTTDRTRSSNHNQNHTKNEVPHQAVLEILKDCSSKTLACLLGGAADKMDTIPTGFDLDLDLAPPLPLPQQPIASSPAMSTNSLLLPEKFTQTQTEMETDSSGKTNNNSSVFDSERKPKRSILKRRGKFSGGDSGCIMPDDLMPFAVRPGDGNGNNNNSETNSSVVPKSGNLPKRLPSFRGEADGIFASKHRISQLLQGEENAERNQQQSRSLETCDNDNDDNSSSSNDNNNDKSSAIMSIPNVSSPSSESSSPFPSHASGQISQQHQQQYDDVVSSQHHSLPQQQQLQEQAFRSSHPLYDNNTDFSISSYPPPPPAHHHHHHPHHHSHNDVHPPPSTSSSPLSTSSSSFTDSSENPSSVPIVPSPTILSPSSPYDQHYHYSNNHHRNHHNHHHRHTRPTTNLLTTSSASAPCLNLLSQQQLQLPPRHTTTTNNNTNTTTLQRPVDDAYTNPSTTNPPTSTIIVKDATTTPTPTTTTTTKVIRRPKSILKASKTSQLEEARNRLSISSIGSNSSADFLDLSYDSGDSDHFINVRNPLSPSHSPTASTSTPDDHLHTNETSPPDSVYGSNRASMCLDEDFDSLKLASFQNDDVVGNLKMTGIQNGLENLKLAGFQNGVDNNLKMSGFQNDVDILKMTGFQNGVDSLKTRGFQQNGMENDDSSTTNTNTTTISTTTNGAATTTTNSRHSSSSNNSPVLAPRDQQPEVVSLEKAEVVRVIPTTPSTTRAIFSEVESPMLYRLAREAKDLTLH